MVKTAPIQKYCKVCHDAGKSESEYRSHFIRETRDPNSKVTCPTLLNLECRFCFKRGHTVKYCKVLKEKNAPRAPTTPAKLSEEKPKVNKYTNTFLYLDEEDEEVVVAPAFKDEFPVLAATKPGRMLTGATNYAAALSKIDVPIPDPIIAPIHVSTQEHKLAPWKTQPNAQASASILPSRSQRPMPMRSWADDSDSEDEEELASRYEIVDDNSAW